MQKLLNNPKTISQIEKKIGYSFKNKEILCNAFVHSSYARQNSIEDNERLEFFGDALLETIVTEHLFFTYPSKDAGQLSKARASLVSSESLKFIVEKMNVANNLLMAGGSRQIKNSSVKTQANLFEALLCAVYLDGGMENAQQFTMRWLKPLLSKVSFDRIVDYKTFLQEYCQANKIALSYLEVLKSGPDNKPVYRYAVCMDGRHIAEGQGSNIKLAQAQAAKKAIAKLKLNG